jgi:hypothetical protein
MKELILNAINFLNISNPSNFLPYHNIDHLWMVYNYCQKITDMINNSDVKETELFIAALFHDYNHSGGKLTDNFNIDNAIEGVTLFHKAHPEFDLNYVSYLIKCTEYPYSVLDIDLTIEAKILRDADLSYVFEYISIVKLYCGLRKEFNQTLILFLNNQFNFLSNINFYIPEFQNLWKGGIQELRLLELEELKAHV